MFINALDIEHGLSCVKLQIKRNYLVDATASCCHGLSHIVLMNVCECNEILKPYSIEWRKRKSEKGTLTTHNTNIQ